MVSRFAVFLCFAVLLASLHASQAAPSWLRKAVASRLHPEDLPQLDAVPDAQFNSMFFDFLETRGIVDLGAQSDVQVVKGIIQPHVKAVDWPRWRTFATTDNAQRQRATTRGLIVDNLIVQAYLETVEATKTDKNPANGKIHVESVGSAKATSDYDLTVHGLHADTLIDKFVQDFAALFPKTNSAYIFDTNLYGYGWDIPSKFVGAFPSTFVANCFKEVEFDKVSIDQGKKSTSKSKVYLFNTDAAAIKFQHAVALSKFLRYAEQALNGHETMDLSLLNNAKSYAKTDFTPKLDKYADKNVAKELKDEIQSAFSADLIDRNTNALKNIIFDLDDVAGLTARYTAYIKSMKDIRPIIENNNQLPAAAQCLNYAQLTTYSKILSVEGYWSMGPMIHVVTGIQQGHIIDSLAVNFFYDSFVENAADCIKDFNAAIKNKDSANHFYLDASKYYFRFFDAINKMVNHPTQKCLANSALISEYQKATVTVDSLTIPLADAFFFLQKFIRGKPDSAVSQAGQDDLAVLPAKMASLTAAEFLAFSKKLLPALRIQISSLNRRRVDHLSNYVSETTAKKTPTYSVAADPRTAQERAKLATERDLATDRQHFMGFVRTFAIEYHRVCPNL